MSSDQRSQLRVRIVTTASFPDGQAATSRIRCYARALSEAGNTVEVVAPHNFGQILLGNRWLHRGVFAHSSFLLLSNNAQVRTGWARYIWGYSSPVFLLLHTICTFWRSDVFILYFSTAMTRFLMMGLLRCLGKKVILELNEYPYATEGSRLTQFPFVKQLLCLFTLKLIFPLANGFLVISKRLELLAGKHGRNSKALRLPILVEKSYTESSPVEVPIQNPYLFHAGSLSEQKDGIVEVFEAFALAHAALLKKHDVRLKIFLTNKLTYPKIWKAIEGVLSKNKLQDQIEITGFCNDEKLEHYLRESLALVINKPVNNQNLNNFPTKLGTYLGSGSPVIVAAKDMELNQFLTNEINGIVVPPNDVEKIAEAIIRCYEDPEFARSIGQAGVNTVNEHFFYHNYSDRLSQFIKSL